MKRLRNDATVRLAKCDFKGNVEGDYVDGTGSIISSDETIRTALGALRRKYGWKMWLADIGARLTGKMNRRAYLEIELAGSPGWDSDSPGQK